MKYHVELSGGEALFGAGVTGTRTVDYELSEVDNGTPVANPGDCLPVLMDIPATDDAQDVERMPGSLRYTSASSPETVQAFFEFLGLPAPAMRALTKFPEKDILPMVWELPV